MRATPETRPSPDAAASREPLHPRYIEQWARQFANARLTGRPVSTSLPEPRTAEDAFAIQRAVTALLNDRAGGWKTAGMSPDGLPLVAPLLEKSIHTTPAVWKNLQRQPIVVEVEFVLGLRDDLSNIDTGRCRDGRELIREVAVGFEICGSRFSDSPSRPLFLADGLANSGLVVGAGVPAGPDFCFSGRRVQLTVNGVVVTDTVTSDASNPADSLLWLVRTGLPSKTLKGGALVITGSLTGVTSLEPGDEAVASIEGIGSAQIRLR